MTKDHATAVLGMKADDLLAFDLVDAHLFENLQGQRDDALSRIAAYDAEKAVLIATHKAETDALNVTIKDTQAVVDALGGTAAGQAMKKAQDIAAAQAAVTAADAAKLDAEKKLAELQA